MYVFRVHTGRKKERERGIIDFFGKTDEGILSQIKNFLFFFSSWEREKELGKLLQGIDLGELRSILKFHEITSLDITKQVIVLSRRVCTVHMYVHTYIGRQAYFIGRK